MKILLNWPFGYELNLSKLHEIEGYKCVVMIVGCPLHFLCENHVENSLKLTKHKQKIETKAMFF